MLLDELAVFEFGAMVSMPPLANNPLERTRFARRSAPDRWAATHVETRGRSCSVRDHCLTGEHNEA